ncbi:MAG: response regulator [Bacteroidales bacterium]|nr:response regulator [Bacteroidales bacterium]
MKMRYLLIAIVCILLGVQLQAAEKKNVLILNSYHKGLQWTDEIQKGIKTGLNSSKLEKEIYTEFFDSKRFFDASYKQVLVDYLMNKYQNLKFDIIILSDDYALTFLFENRDSLFGDVPVVFSGINNPHIYPSSYTGILEDIKYIESFELIKKLHPNYSKIYFIVDETKTGNIIYDRAFRLYLPEQGEFNYEFLRNYSFDELFEKVSALDDNAVLMLTAFTKDRNNEYCSYDDIIKNLRKHTKLPIYGSWDFYLGNGIVGGKLNSGYNQGLRAGEIANQVLEGKNINEINIEISHSKYYFDYVELKSHKIKRRYLPKSSIIINHPLSFLVENKQQTIFFSIISILLLIIIMILWFFLMLKKRKNNEEIKFRKNLEISNEKLLLAKEKIEESNRLKTAFIANMSHEFRTPMNGIIGFSELLKDDSKIDNETKKRYFEIIQESGRILLNLVDDIIDLSRIESSKLRLNYKEFKIADVLDELLSFIISERDNLKKDNIKILLEKEFDYQNLVIYSDKDRLKQVLHNLLSNALKFTSKGSIRFGFYIESPNIVFFVKDTGIGLSDDERGIIFDQFRQVEDYGTRKFGGSGLGLSLSKGIVENLKGHIWVDSEKGEGSTFLFSIPYKMSPEFKNEAKEKSHESNYEWPNKTILIVEDAIISYQLLTKFLKDCKVSFLHAEDGEQAVKMCNINDDIDLVLMDVQLPIMNGLEATRQIKLMKPNLPIIAQTANAMVDDRANIINAGCDDYIAKPINRYELYEKINNFLQ